MNRFPGKGTEYVNDLPDEAHDQDYELTLFISGASDLSARAVSEAQQLCEAHVAGRYHLSIVDVHGDPTMLQSSGVLATPTLVKYLPPPVRHLVGDLADGDWSVFSSVADSDRMDGRHSSDGSSNVHPRSDRERPFRRRTRENSGSPDAASSIDFIRMAEMEETLRAIRAGEVDGFVVYDETGTQRIFTLMSADHPYRMFVENMLDGAATISSTGRILYANEQFAKMLLCTRETLVGLPLAAFLAGEGSSRLLEVYGPGRVGFTVEVELLNSDGAVVPVRLGSSPLNLVEGDVTCVTFTDLSLQRAQDRKITSLGQAQAQQLSDLQAAQAALIEQATHDSLTGLPNRSVLVDRIGQALSQARRSGDCTAVLFVDLDRFKQVNDTQGHAAGDILLRGVAKQLTESVRSMDTVARIGGDEFVILAPGVDTDVHAVDIGNHILTALNRSSDSPEGVAASVGIAVSVAGKGTAETLLHEADTAMYQAKLLGRGRVELFDADLRRQILERSSSRQALQSALDDRRIVAYYQPIVELSDGSVAGFEALARLVEDDGSVLAPAAFMPIAEDSGLVVPLGSRVLNLACEQPPTWTLGGGDARSLAVAVNVSGRQLESGEFPGTVRDALERSGLPPSRLHLELIETAIIDLHPDILRQLSLIRDLGVEIGLDDFGTGYASLTHLRRLPLTFVKIDRSFVEGLETNGGDERIVSAVVDLAANLGLRSIAEGIETRNQLDRLRDLGCDQAQGYFFTKPLSAVNATNYVQAATW